MLVRTLYDPITEIGPEFVSEYSDNIYYYYGPEVDRKYLVIAIVHDMPGNTWVIDAEQDIIDRLSSYLPYLDTPNPLFIIGVYAHGLYVEAIAPNPPSSEYNGHKIVSRRPAIRSWENLRKAEYQISDPPPDPPE